MVGLLAAGLDTALDRASLPYGYTVTIWSSGQVLIDLRGTPSAWLAPSYALGALCGFGLLKLVARRAGSSGDDRLAGSRAWAWVVQFATIAASVGVVALVGRIQSGFVWSAGGFLATTVYLAGMAAMTVIEGQAG
jgi:hypothetical protein